MTAELTSEMRRAIDRLRSGPRFVSPREIPFATATALRRRGLVEDAAGSRIRLTPEGLDIAEARLRDRRARFGY